MHDQHPLLWVYQNSIWVSRCFSDWYHRHTLGTRACSIPLSMYMYHLCVPRATLQSLMIGIGRLGMVLTHDNVIVRMLNRIVLMRRYMSVFVAKVMCCDDLELLWLCRGGPVVHVCCVLLWPVSWSSLVCSVCMLRHVKLLGYSSRMCSIIIPNCLKRW